MENLSKVVEFIENVTDFSKFELIETNRAVNKNHATTLAKSFKLFGTGATSIIVLKSKAFGKVRYLIADGQHTIEALTNCGLGGNVLIVELNVDTKLNVTKFITALNNTSKGWTTNAYVDAYALLGIRQYQIFKTLKKETKLTITDLLYIYTGNGVMTDYKNGDLKFPNKTDSDKLLLCVIDMKPLLPNKSYVRRALYKIMRKSNNYRKMTKAIIKRANDLEKVGREFRENEKDFYKELEEIHNETFNPISLKKAA